MLQIPASEILQSVQPIRDVLSRSPFINHLQTWPRGYQGDYEIVEYIMDAVNKSTVGSWAWNLEGAALQSGIVQQHRNKVRFQAEEFARLVAQHGNRWNMLSLGCGGCRDLFQVLPELREFQGEIVLNDTDANALALAQSRLSMVATLRYRILKSHSIKAVRRLEREPTRFRFVLAGGLFDYLSDRAVTSILRTVFHGLLEADGVCMFTNILSGNSFRPWMEYAVNWKLIERSGAQLMELCKQAGIPEKCVGVATDDSRLALIVRIRKIGS